MIISCFNFSKGEANPPDVEEELEEDLAALLLWEDWDVNDLKRLIDFQTSLFLSNFAVYMANKVMTAHNMEVNGLFGFSFLLFLATLYTRVANVL